MLRGTADMHVGMSELLRERTTCRRPPSCCCAARSSASTSGCRRTRTAGGSRWPGSGRPKETSTARSTCSTRPSGVYVGDFSPNVRPIPAMRARVWVAQGRLGRRPRLGARARAVGRRRPQLPARVRAHHAGPGAAGPVPERTAAPSPRRGGGLLERLLQAAEDGGRTGSVIEILVLQALAHQARGDVAAALAPLERALALAEPEGYVRIFVDEGPPMAALLAAAAQRGDRRGLRPPAAGRVRRDRAGEATAGSRA